MNVLIEAQLCASFIFLIYVWMMYFITAVETGIKNQNLYLVSSLQ